MGERRRARAPGCWALTALALTAGLRAEPMSAPAAAPSRAYDAMAGQSSPGTLSSSSTGMPGYNSPAAPAPGPAYDNSYAADAPQEGVTDSPDTALIAELQVDGYNLWPFTADKQQILANSIQYWVLYGTGFVRILDVREGPLVNVTKQVAASGNSNFTMSEPISQPISQPIGRRLLADGPVAPDGMYISPIVKVQVDAGSSLSAGSASGQIRDYAGAPPAGLIAADAQQRGLNVTNITVLNTSYAVPYMPSETSHGEYVALAIGVLLTAGVFFAFLASLDTEKRRLLKKSQRPDASMYQQVGGGHLQGVPEPPHAKTVDDGFAETPAKHTGRSALLGSPRRSAASPRTPTTDQGVLRLWNHSPQGQQLQPLRSGTGAPSV